MKIKGQRQPTKSMPKTGCDAEYSSLYLEEQRLYEIFLKGYGYKGTLDDYKEFTGQD